jgi:hypothetical protein
MIRYFIKRIRQDWSEELGLITGCGLLFLILFINKNIVEYTGWCTDERAIFWGALMIFPEAFILYFICYLTDVYEDYQRDKFDNSVREVREEKYHD